MRIPEAFLRFRRWPVILIGSFAIVFVLGVATVRESYRGWKVDQEIQALEAQALELEGRNKRLLEIAQTLQSPERMEVEARKRLGLKKPGEHVVVLNGLSATGSWNSAVALDVIAERPEIDYPNPLQWYYYFFQPDRLAL